MACHHEDGSGLVVSPGVSPSRRTEHLWITAPGKQFLARRIPQLDPPQPLPEVIMVGVPDVLGFASRPLPQPARNLSGLSKKHTWTLVRERTRERTADLTCSCPGSIAREDIHADCDFRPLSHLWRMADASMKSQEFCRLCIDALVPGLHMEFPGCSVHL